MRRGSAGLVLAEAVRDEVEENLLVHAGSLPSEQADSADGRLPAADSVDEA